MADLQQTFERAFKAPETAASTGTAERISTVVAGMLSLPSAIVAACDPLVSGQPPPFVQTALPGHYPVELALLDLPGKGQRVAMARVGFTQQRPAVWVDAVREGAGAFAQHQDHRNAYQCASGTGAFLDATAVPLLDFASTEEMDNLLLDLTANFKPYRYWLDFPLDRRLNVVMFSAGDGAGTYPSYFGIDGEGDICTLVTDFGLLT
jgi:Protein of unknown function (DUF4241)